MRIPSQFEIYNHLLYSIYKKSLKLNWCKARIVCPKNGKLSNVKLLHSNLNKCMAIIVHERLVHSKSTIAYL